MDVLNADIIDKLFAYPALVGVGYIMWIHYKIMMRLIDVVKESKDEKKD